MLWDRSIILIHVSQYDEWGQDVRIAVPHTSYVGHDAVSPSQPGKQLSAAAQRPCSTA